MRMPCTIKDISTTLMNSPSVSWTTNHQRQTNAMPSVRAGLEAVLRARPVPLLRALPVDLEELAGVLEGDPVQRRRRIDLRTGDVWPWPAIEYAEGVRSRATPATAVMARSAPQRVSDV